MDKLKEEFERKFTKKKPGWMAEFREFYWIRPEKVWNWIEEKIKSAKEEERKKYVIKTKPLIIKDGYADGGSTEIIKSKELKT